MWLILLYIHVSILTTIIRIHDLTYQLIADQSSYAPFSNTAYVDDRGGSYNSLENMHDAIHSLVGQNGHMAYVPFAGFDPIFWLHHTNVDRLFAIWQAIYPDSYTTAQITSEGTFTTAPGETEDVNTRELSYLPVDLESQLPRKKDQSIMTVYILEAFSTHTH